MKREIKKSDTKWHQSENYDATKVTLHCYYDRERTNLFNETTVGSAALCNSKRGVTDSYRFHTIAELSAHTSKGGRCKKCQAIYDKLP